MSYSKEYPNIPKIIGKSKALVIALVMMVMCLLNHSKGFAESNKCPFQGFNNCAACEEIDSSCEADDGFSANSSFGSSQGASGYYGAGGGSTGLNVGGDDCQYTCTQCDDNYELREAECVSCSAEQKAYDSESKECVDCSAKNKGYSPLKGECNNCKPSCTQCCDGCEINAQGEIVYKMGGKELSCNYTQSYPGRWCTQPGFWVGVGSLFGGKNSDTHCSKKATSKWCGGYGAFKQHGKEWCCPREYKPQTDVQTFRVDKQHGGSGKDVTYITGIGEDICAYRNDDLWNPGCPEKQKICESKMGLEWITPEEKDTLAKCVLPDDNAMLGELNKMCLRCKDGYKLDGKHCVEIPTANRKKIVAGEDLRLGKVKKCKSIGGEWMHESGNQNDSAFCKVKKGTEFDEHLCEKYGGRIEKETCVNLDCNESQVALKGQCFFKDYVKSDCKIAGCEQCLPSMVSCKNCEDGKKLVNINQLSDEEYLNMFAQGNEDSINIAKKKDLLGLFGQTTCVDEKNRDRPGFDSRSLCTKLKGNQTAQDNKFAPGHYRDSVYSSNCPSNMCKNEERLNQDIFNKNSCYSSSVGCACFSCDEKGCISKTSGCKDTLCSVCDMDGECLVYEGNYCKIAAALDGCNTCSKGGLNEKRECYACDPGYNLNNGRCEKTERTLCHQNGGVWSDENQSCESTAQPKCNTRINGKCRTDETECCSDGQITLTFSDGNGEAESRCFTPLKEIWNKAKTKTQQTLKRTCDSDEVCNNKANELGDTYKEFKDGAPCRLPKDKLVEKHFDDMKQTCIDEKLRWNPILKQCDNNCEEKFTKWLSDNGIEGGKICDTRVSINDKDSCVKCKYGSLRVGLNDVCCSKKDKACNSDSDLLKKEFDGDKLSDAEKDYVKVHDLNACLSKRYPPQWETFDFPSWREGECGKWTKESKSSRDCLSDYQKFLTSKGKVHNSKSACEMAGGYPEFVSYATKDNENYIYEPHEEKVGITLNTGKYFKCIFPVKPPASADKCVEDELKQHVSDLIVPTELSGIFNDITKKCRPTGTSEKNFEDFWHSFTDGEGNRDKAEFRLGEAACHQIHLDTKDGVGWSKADDDFNKMDYCTFNKSPKSCHIRRNMEGEAPEFKDTWDDSCEFCLHGFKTTAKGNKMTQELWTAFSTADSFDRDDFEKTLTALIEKNYEGKHELEGTKKVVKMLGGKVMWKNIFSSGLMKDDTIKNIKLLKKMKFRSLSLPSAITYLVAYLNPNDAHVCCWPHEGPEDGCSKFGASMGADPNYSSNAEWISEETGTYLPPGCEYQDIHKKVINKKEVDLLCKDINGEWQYEKCYLKDRLSDTMSVEPKDGQCPETYTFDNENDKCVIPPLTSKQVEVSACDKAGGTWDSTGRYVNRNTCELDGGVYSSTLDESGQAERKCTFPQITDGKKCENMGGEFKNGECIREICEDIKPDYDGRCLFDIDHLTDTMSVEPKDGQCPETYTFDNENNKCVIPPPLTPVTVDNDWDKCTLRGGYPIKLNGVPQESLQASRIAHNDGWYRCQMPSQK